MSAVTKHLIISGKVQGVGYRAWMVRTAAQEKLGGWVRNRSDGTVEALLHGPGDRVQAVIDRARKGPLLAKVTDIAEQDETGYDGPPVFEVRETV